MKVSENRSEIMKEERTEICEFVKGFKTQLQAFQYATENEIENVLVKRSPHKVIYPWNLFIVH